MSYVSLIKNLPEVLSQPAGIAALASLGIHGAIGFILPLMPVDSKTEATASQRNVGLVNLTPAEQSRLPQVSTPEQSLLPQISTSQPVKLPNFATQPGVVSSLPQGSSYSGLSLPLLGKTPVSGYPVSSLPKSSYVRIPLPGQSSTDTSFNQSRTAAKAAPPSFDSRVKFKPYTRLPNDLPILEAAKLPTVPDGRPDISTYYSPQTIPTPQATPNPEENQPTVRFNPEPNSSATPTPENYADRKLALNRELGLESKPTTPSPTYSPSAELAQTTERLGTLAKWYGEVQEKYKDEKVVTAAPIQEKITDQPGVNGTAVVGVVVNSEGKISDVDVLNHSGSGDIEKAATNFVNNYGKFRKNGKPTVYQFSLTFQYDGSSPEVKPDAAKPAPTKPAPTKLEPLRVEPAKPGPLRLEPAKLEPVLLEPAKPDKKPDDGKVLIERLRDREVKPEPVGEPQAKPEQESNDAKALIDRLRDRQANR